MHKTQSKILQAIDDNGGKLSKKLRDIGKAIGEDNPHPQQIKNHVLQLEKRGLIRINHKENVLERVGINTEDESNAFISIPILGKACCGSPLAIAEENLEGFLKISKNLLEVIPKKSLFVLKATGDSMNDADVGGDTIEDGDYVIIDSEERNPQNGDYVLSVIDGGANIKKFVRDTENNQIVLLSESKTELPPIYIHEDDAFMVNGTIKQVIKKPKF